MKPRLHIGRWIVVAFVCVWSLFPIYWALNTSLMSTPTAQSVPARFLPIPFTFSSYRQIFSGGGDNAIWPSFSKALANTTLECAAATLLTVVVAVLGAYAFARLKFRFKNAILFVVIATLSLPAYATLIPLYRMMANWHLVNTYTGIVLVYVSGFLPLALWILYNYFSTIPVELDEAAFMDGASPLKTMVHIMLPLSSPGLASAAIITFLSAWGQFLFPLVLASNSSTQPFTVFMTSLESRHTIPYPLMNAVGVLSIVIPALIVVFLNRFIIRGLIAGSSK
ncbi:carbohydrate ABC transporter permease [Alicyclobacillus fastidiosus]|uniref:Carbohydrate ABC transporter permease n=1 Tax=Alicyclobacillus fastidiosus TaxID=392011 RepID=A0ABV5A8Q6_9BACL|nr:carbohydrate ABC transporter permease [Alicyclobacillus fastidiosus]WEH10626.1 carbohydrate ABC transporter permease [Alicyclobacillus fastidiosus]